MKALKKIVYLLMILCMLLCTGVLICALVPGLSERISLSLYGEKNAKESAVKIEDADADHIIYGSTTAGIEWETLPFQGNLGYVIPAEQNVYAPDGLAQKNGWLGISSTTQQVEEDEAEKILETLGIGDPGTDISFSELYAPYYSMLTSEMKQLYCQIYANAQNCTEQFQPVVKTTDAELSTVFEAVIGDHPELFWMDTAYGCKIDRTGNVLEITLKFYELTDRLDNAKNEFEKAAQKILSGAADLNTDLERETYLHDSLVESVTYDLSAPMNQSAYSAIVEGKTVCAGYARAFQYLMQNLGIPCFYCTGYSGQDHAWNIVYVNQLFRNVDVTWDDMPEISYDYFNRSDAEFFGTHMRKGLSVYLPVCPSEGEDAPESALDAIRGLINPNPIKPITLDHPGEILVENQTVPVQNVSNDIDDKKLREAGISASEVMTGIDAYYNDCRRRIVAAGSGQIEFSNVIPAQLWNSIEAAYAGGGYKSGYVDAALKELGEENFAIHLRAVKLSDDFYRLYHSVATW